MDSTLGISAALARISPPGRFATHFTQPADGLHIEIDGLGPVPLPIDPLVARALCEAAELAMHGFKDETRMDTRVRDTWEIPAARIRIDEARWQRVLSAALQRIHKALGMPEGSVLRADLHNLLVYEKGQFFARHQDSEKSDGMLATLVVSLPSRFTGGRFVIEHQGASLRAGGSATRLGFTAFFADCAHEAQPVKSGYRVVLTYNLSVVVSANAPVAPAQNSHVDDLVALLRRHFTMPAAARWAGDTRSDPPDRLIYLLDHQYTQRGLDWTLLKNADAPRVAALRSAADALDCECILALADVRETWSCEGGADEDPWDEGGEYYGDEGPEDSAQDLELGELIDGDIELRHGLSAAGMPVDVMGARADDSELCLTRPSRELKPFQSEYEGFMGNYGNTLDRWYHRAAVVIWPRARSFELSAKAAPASALQSIHACLCEGQGQQAAELVHRLLPYWKHLPIDDIRLAGLALKTAYSLNDAELAVDLLAPFQAVSIPVTGVEDFAGLSKRYSLSWCRALLQRWADTRDRQHIGVEQRDRWIAEVLPALGEACCAINPDEGPELASLLIENQWTWLQHRIREEQCSSRIGARERTQRLRALDAPLLGVLEASVMAGAGHVSSQIRDLLAHETNALPIEVTILLLRHAQKHVPIDAPVAAQLGALQSYAVRELERRLAQPARASDDWSIAVQLDCRCQDCKTLTSFLTASGERLRNWPLVTAGREHIAQTIHRHDLPVTCSTVRKGRPYTLVLEKSLALFQREALSRQRWCQDLECLRAFDWSESRSSPVRR